MSRFGSWRLQFSLATLLTILLVASFLLASYGGVLREMESQGSTAFLVSLLMLTAAPLALVIAISGLRAGLALWSRRHHRRRSD